MKILFVAAEAVPFIKVGGLGDVIGALPKTLVEKGLDARVVLPLYAAITQELRDTMTFLGSIEITHSWRESYCGIYQAMYQGVIYYFIDNEQYFLRNNIYGEYDDAERFSFFSKAALAMLPMINFFPDIIHANDWHAAMVPVYLNIFYKELKEYSKIKTVLSIHNIEFQGKYDPIILGSVLGLDITHRPLMIYDGCLNILKGGIESADMITTVSESYANEILYPNHSYGLHHILQARKEKIKGIVNGIDTKLFDPSTDQAVAVNYNYETIRNKSLNKKRLQKDLGLEQKNDTPIIGMVTRLTPQKGIDLIREVMPQIVELDMQFILLGSGYAEYETFLYGWENARRDKVRSMITFSSDMASKIYAGADLFLMPSMSEPCGLSQMIAMRYGTIPIVHAVGGLRDTVEAYNPETKTGVGITFQRYDAQDMLDAIKRGLELYHDKKNWRQLKKNAMACDFSWEKSANKYVELYKNL